MASPWYFGGRPNRYEMPQFRPYGGFNVGDPPDQSPAPGVSGQDNAPSSFGGWGSMDTTPDTGAGTTGPGFGSPAPGTSLSDTNPGAAQTVADVTGMVGNPGKAAGLPFGLSTVANTGLKSGITALTGIPSMPLGFLQMLASVISGATNQGVSDAHMSGNPALGFGPTTGMNPGAGSFGVNTMDPGVPSFTPTQQVQNFDSTYGSGVGGAHIGPDGTTTSPAAVPGNAQSDDPDIAAGQGTGPGTGTPGGPSGGGVSGGAPGSGGDSGTGPGGQGLKKGGKVQRPTDKHLADRLRAGAPVNAGQPGSTTDDVPVKLQRGEFVVNRAATQSNEPTLRKMNAAGAGGFSVGPRSR